MYGQCSANAGAAAFDRGCVKTRCAALSCRRGQFERLALQQKSRAQAEMARTMPCAPMILIIRFML